MHATASEINQTGAGTWEDSLNNDGVSQKNKLAFTQGGQDGQAHHAKQLDFLATLRHKIIAASYEAGGTDLEELFKDLDADGLRRIMPLSSAAVHRALQATDGDSDGYIDYKEFVAFLSEKKQRVPCALSAAIGIAGTPKASGIATPGSGRLPWTERHASSPALRKL